MQAEPLRLERKDRTDPNVIDFLRARDAIRPPPPGSLAATLRNIDAVRVRARMHPDYDGGGNG